MSKHTKWKFGKTRYTIRKKKHLNDKYFYIYSLIKIYHINSLTMTNNTRNKNNKNDSKKPWRFLQLFTTIQYYNNIITRRPKMSSTLLQTRF